MRLLQVCNVGQILGGTAACAWSVTRALPDVSHEVICLSRISTETRQVFAPVRLHQRDRVTRDLVRHLRPDVVLLHNVAPGRCERLPEAWTLQWVHSAGPRAGADQTVYCSQWLRSQSASGQHDRKSGDVLWQGVPHPGSGRRETRQRSSDQQQRTGDGPLVIGRICTPTLQKWPTELIVMYERLAVRFPAVMWEFVGCPKVLQSSLRSACLGRCRFHPAGWSARRHLMQWDALLYHHPHLTESFGRTVAEALRAGCLPIVDARGGFCEQIVPGTGWLCKSLGDFERAIRELQVGDRDALSQAAHQRGEELFSLRALRSRLLGLLARAGVDPPVTH